MFHISWNFTLHVIILFFPKVRLCILLLTILSFQHNLEPPCFTVEPESQDVLPASTVRFKGTFKGTTPLTVKWFKGDTELVTGGACYIMTEALASYLELYAVKPTDSGKYTCKVSNVAGSVTCSANLFVKGLHSYSLLNCQLLD